MWALESIYKLRRDLILTALLELAALPNVEIEDATGLAKAVRKHNAEERSFRFTQELAKFTNS